MAAWAASISQPLSAQTIHDQQHGSPLYAGDYHFTPEQRVYRKNYAPLDRAGSFNDFWQGTSTLLDRSRNALNYRDTEQDGGLRVGVGAGLAGGAFGLRRSTIDTFNADPRYLHVNLGPLMFDQFIVGAGAIWVDENGFVPGSNGDDGWGGLVWASMRVSFMLADSLIISLQPSVYWSFENNKVGWMFNPFSASLRPNVLGELSYDFEVGNWRFNIYDRVGAVLAAGRWFTFPSRQTASGSIIDQVGRYGFGMNGQVEDWSIEDRAGLSNWEDYMRYYNFIGFNGQTYLSDTVTLQTYVGKSDLWDNRFNHVRAGIDAGAWISVQGPFIQPFAGYLVATREPYDVYGHQVFAGAKFMLRHDLTGSASVGYLTTTGTSSSRDSWLGMATLQWQMSPFTTHYLAGGRRVLNSVYLPLSLDDFVEYRLTQQIGFNANVTFVMGTIQREQLEEGRGGGDAHVNYVGASLMVLLTDQIRMSVVSGYENIDRGNLDLQRWTHRLNLETMLSETVGLQSFYQYMENTGSFNFTEHALFLGVNKRF